MWSKQDARYLAAIVSALVRRAGGSLTLPASEISSADSDYELNMKADRQGQNVELWTEPAEELVEG